MQRKIAAGPACSQRLPAAGRARASSVTTLYLTILSRYPTDAELQRSCEAYAQAGGANRRGAAHGPGLGADQQRGVSVTGIEPSRSEVTSRSSRPCSKSRSDRCRASRLCSRRRARCIYRRQRGSATHAVAGGMPIGWPGASGASRSGQRPAAAPAGNAPPPGRAKAVIQIWMWGGPCAPRHVRSQARRRQRLLRPARQAHRRPTSTASRSASCCRCWRKQADKYSIIRSMTHGINAHETASYMVQTGRTPGERARLSRRRRRRVAASRATTPATRA